MRLFDRSNVTARKLGANIEEGKRRASAGRKNLAARKLGLESLEDRQLLSVNPIGASEYQDLRETYANLDLPQSLDDVNVIQLTDLSPDALQQAVDLAAQTPQDDLILLETTADNYVINLESTAVKINIDSANYGALTIVSSGTEAATIETVESNAFTVLSGDVKFDGVVSYNYSSLGYAGNAVVSSSNANVTLGNAFVAVTQMLSKDAAEDGSSYVIDRAATANDSEEVNSMPTSAYRVRERIEDSPAVVRNAVHAALKTQFDYFGWGYTPSTLYAPNLQRGSIIYDADARGAGWIGTVSNMLAYTGWAEKAGFSTRMTLSDGSVATFDSVEDAVATYLSQGFINTDGGFYSSAYNYGITAASIIDYLFSGNDEDCMGKNFTALTNTIEGGGFFTDIDFSTVGGYVAASDSMLQDMLAAVRAGNAVTMEIVTTDSYGNASREYVSVWGYLYDPNSVSYTPDYVSNGAANTVVGLICTNPNKGSYQQPVTEVTKDGETIVKTSYTHYVDDANPDGVNYNTYHTYMLSGSGANLTLVHAPYTYIDDAGAVHGEISFPEGYSFYGRNNEQYNTYTSKVVGFSWIQQYSENMSSTPVTSSDATSLQSMPGNTENVIYLCFEGTGAGWDGYTHTELNLDNAAGFGVEEQKFIEEVWRRVSEDYAPFNVNVTTSSSIWASAKNGVRCVISDVYNPNAGGLSIVNCFGTSKQDNYVYTLSLKLSPKAVAEAASHEVGHAMGLHHDGYEHDDYAKAEYSGNSSWAPIMGAGYGAALTQWSQGEYVGATNTEDDVAIIAAKVGYRKDDYGGTIETAEALENHYVGIDININNPDAGTYKAKGVIEKRTDYDVFSFTSYGGTYVVDVVGTGADSREIDADYSWTHRNYSSTENAVFGGLYYATSYNYTNLNIKTELLDETGEIVLLDMNGQILKLSFGESIVLRETDYYFYVIDQFGEKVYYDEEKTQLKEGYQAVDDTSYSTFSHFVTPELEEGKTYYIRVSGVGEGNPLTNGYSDYGSLGQYTLSMHESYENFRIDDARLDVTDISYDTGVDNTLNWQEAMAYARRRLENGTDYLGNTLVFNESLSGATLQLNNTLYLSNSNSLVGQVYSAKRVVFDAMSAWNEETEQPGITIDAGEKFRAIYVDNTTVELYGFVITGGVSSNASYMRTGQQYNGGGIYNHYGWLTVGNTIIAGNSAQKAGGGVYNEGGEYENTDQHDGWLYLINSSIIGNVVTQENSVGGGLYNEAGGLATLVNVTIAGNTAQYSGGGLQNAGVVYLYNSIIAKNQATYGVDVYTQKGVGSKLTMAYSSLIGDESRNKDYFAQINGLDTTYGDDYSLIGKSLGTSAEAEVITYDPKFVGFRNYSMLDWSVELWKFWNFRLTGDSPAVDLGITYTAANLDFNNDYCAADSYKNQYKTRYIVSYTKDLSGQNRIENGKVDAGAYELLHLADLTGYVPTSAGADVVNNWQSSIVISRAIDDQTGSVAPFLVDENLYLNLCFINQGKSITENFETTVYLWKYAPTATKKEMMEKSTIETGVALMNISVVFGLDSSMPGGTGVATITCTNLATGEEQTYVYDGKESYILLENVALGSLEDVVDGLIAKGKMQEQNEEGYFVFGYQLDSSKAIEEMREDNNFFLTTSYYDVVESPVSTNESIVVTTELDKVDAYDGLISLREAVEIYAGSFYYSEIALKDGDVFQAGGVTYYVKDGKFFVDSKTEYQVYPGESFTFEEKFETSGTWDGTKYVDAEGQEVVPATGATTTIEDVEYTYNGIGWFAEDGTEYIVESGETIVWYEKSEVVVTYRTDVYYDENEKLVDVPEGTKGKYNDQEVELIDGAWVHVEETASYTRDDIQKQGEFTLSDGTQVVVVNGVFRRVATGDVAIVPDESVVTLATGEEAVYDSAKDRFVVTETTVYTVSEGFEVTVNGDVLTFVEDSYVDSYGQRYYIAEGAQVTLKNGYVVTYHNGSFVYETKVDSEVKLTAGETVILNGEEYAYKAGLALVRRVSREANAVVFESYLDGKTFLLEMGYLTFAKSFTLASVDPDGKDLDLTVSSVSDDPRLFVITEDADVTIANFKFRDTVSVEEGSIIENYGSALLSGLIFTDNSAAKGNLIYNAANAKVTIEVCSFSGNQMDEGALIYNLGDAVVQGTTEEYTSFEGDFALMSPIYNENVLQMQYVRFDSTSAANGGAINNKGGRAIVANAEFIATQAQEDGKGGAIYNTNAGTFSVDAASFEGTSANLGGAVFNDVDSEAKMQQVVFDSSEATGDGGAIYNAGSLTLDNSEFKANQAGGVGGAVFSAEASNLSFTQGVAFEGNKATTAGAVMSYVSFKVEGNLVATGNMTFMDEVANEVAQIGSGDVGAIAVQGSLEVTGDLSLEGNKAIGSFGALAISGNLKVDGDLFAKENQAGAGYGAIAVTGNLTVEGSAELKDNVALSGAAGAVSADTVKIGGETIAIGNTSTSYGGAFSVGTKAEFVGKANFSANEAENGGAIAVVGTTGSLKLVDATFVGNKATATGGAIFSAADFSISNALFAQNEAGTLGGALYLSGVSNLTNVTIADNTAGDAAGLYNAGTAALSNSILANNVTTKDETFGVDLYTAQGATTTLQSSLLYNIEQVGEVAYSLNKDYRSILGVDPELNKAYGLESTSPAINAGSNALDGNKATDLAGNARRVGLTIAGVVRTVDMGAFEYQTIQASDLTYEDNPVDLWQVEIKVGDADPTEMSYFVANSDVCFDFVLQNQANDGVETSRVIDNFAYSVKLVGVDSKGNLVYDKTQTFRYKETFDRYNWLNVADWINPGESKNLDVNLGLLPSGVYSMEITLDVLGVGAVYEYGEEDGYVGENNNIYSTSFVVFETPSVVVTTENDVVDPYDSKISLREAIAYAGNYEIQAVTTLGRFILPTVGTDISFASSIAGKTIAIDPVKGAMNLSSQISLGVNADGEEVFVDRYELSIIGGANKMTVSGENASGIFVVDSDMTVDISDVALKNGRAEVGGAILNNGTLTLSKVNFANNKAIGLLEDAQDATASETGLGGAVANFGSLTVNTAEFRSNGIVAGSEAADVAGGYSILGGAIYNANEMILDAATFVGNAATYAGGAVFNAQDASMSFTSGVTFDGNKAAMGGALITFDEFEITGDLVAKNNAAVVIETKDEANEESEPGSYGAIVSYASITVTGAATFENNTAATNIGAGYIEGDFIVTGDLTVKNNVADSAIGAIKTTGALKVDGVATISGNEAKDGSIGAIEADSMSVGGSLTVENNKASKSVGAINIANDLSITGDLTAKLNNAGESVGAIEINGALTIGGNAIIEGNTATQDVGAVKVVKGMTLTTGDLTVKNNNAGQAVGAIQVGEALTVGGAATISGNEAKDGSVGAIEAKSMSVGGSLTAENNKASKSVGAINIANDLSVTGDLTAKLNNAGESVGAIEVDGTLTIGGNAAFEGNTAGQDVGAVKVVKGMELTTGALTVKNNSAGTTVGAVQVDETLSVGGAATISGNEAKDGSIGAIAAKSVSVTGAATIENNKASKEVGAIDAVETVSFGAALTLTGNEAQNGSAGAIRAQSITVEGKTTAKTNKASQNGGAIVIETAEFKGAVELESNEAQIGGALYATDKIVLSDALTIAKNKATAKGGAVYSTSDVTVGGKVVATDNEANDGGAFYVEGNLVLNAPASFTGNKATVNGGAVYANNLTVSDALFAKNTANEKGGAIYVNTAKLANVTIANNTAAQGGGLFVNTNATIDNSILAANSATDGVDIFVKSTASILLRNSLLQNAESTGELAFTKSWMNADYRCFIGVDPEFVDAANGNYALKSTSVGVNTGSNALASGSELDLAGAARIVGLTVKGVVCTIDMGAYEYQTSIAPDLSFTENPINFWYATRDGKQVENYYVGTDVILDFTFQNANADKASAMQSVFDKFDVTYKIEGATAAGEAYEATITQRYQNGSTYFDWQLLENSLEPNETYTYLRQNLGSLEVGEYTITITLDSRSEIVEWGEEDGSEKENNNVYTTTFRVFERPDLVVTTTDDVVDPIDDVISLREAVEEYVGPYDYSSKYLVDSASFVRDDMVVVTVKDGVATIGNNVASVDGGAVKDLVDGDVFEYGKSYVVYENGFFTYPDGTKVEYAPKTTSDKVTITLADGTELVAKPVSKIEYLISKSQPYTSKDLGLYVDVLVSPDGTQTLLTDLTPESIVYDITNIVYREFVVKDAKGVGAPIYNNKEIVVNGVEGYFLNGAFVANDGESYKILEKDDVLTVDGVDVKYVGSAFVKEDLSLIDFVDGGEILCENGSVIATSVERVKVDSVTTFEGDRYRFGNDGTMEVVLSVGNEITFSKDVFGAGATISLVDGEITVAKKQTISAEDLGVRVAVDAHQESRVFNVNSGVEVTIDSLSMLNGKETKGGAIINNGNLTLKNDYFDGNWAYSEGEIEGKVLEDGVGGGVYNEGTLTIDSSEFQTNDADYFGAGVYSVGSLTVKNSTFKKNFAKFDGGAMYILNSNATIESSIFDENYAIHSGAAITISLSNASGSLNVANSLFTNNSAIGSNGIVSNNGGAIYAFAKDGLKADVTMTNVTLADNSARFGGGFYGDNANLTLKNSIVATNTAGEAGDDLYFEGTSSVLVYNSLIGDGQEIGAAAISVAQGATALIGTTEAKMDPVFASDYSLQATSPALNSGDNQLLTGFDFDVYGNKRVVGIEFNNVVYSIDMGAVETQTVYAPDLQVKDVNSEKWYGSIDNESLGEFVAGWDVAFDYTLVNAGTALVIDGFTYTYRVDKIDESGNVLVSNVRSGSRSYGDDVYGYMSKENWLGKDATIADTWNIGTLEPGLYQLTVNVDCTDATYDSSKLYDVVELNEGNNVKSTVLGKFNVVERQSLVVTTGEDVVDTHDGKISLREAVDFVNPSGSSTTTIDRKLAENDFFQLAKDEYLGIPEGAIAVYANGSMTYVNASGETVALTVGQSYALANGEKLVWNGANQVQLASTIYNSISFASNVATAQLSKGEIAIDATMTIDGGTSKVQVDAQNASRVFLVARGDVALKNLKLANGSSEEGGLVYNAVNDLSISNVDFTNGFASILGGAVYNAKNAGVSVYGSTFDGNEATNGASVYNAGTFSVDHSTFKNGSATNGAAIYNVEETNVNLGVTFFNNVATGEGGAIYNEGGTLNVTGTASEKVKFDTNKATYGGAVVNYQGTATISYATFAANSATDAGAIDNYGALILKNVDMLRNSATGYGGAIYNSSSSADVYTVDLENVFFEENVADKGAALYNAKGSKVVGKSDAEGAYVKFCGNNAKASGGAIYNLGSVDGNNWLLQANVSTDGGAIYNAGTVALTNSTFLANLTNLDGAAVYNAGKFYATSVKFENNNANGLGGAITNVAKAEAVVSNSAFKLNTAEKGGAIANAGTLTLRNTTVAANTATEAGGLYNNGKAYAYNTIIANNFAIESGADVVADAVVKLYNSLIGVDATKVEKINSKTGDAGFKVAAIFDEAGHILNIDSVDLTLTSTSQAVDSGSNAYALDAFNVKLEFDLAGNIRICTSRSSVDMGAYEFPFEEWSSIVTTVKDVVDPTDGLISLREALDYAFKLGEKEITFTVEVTQAGKIALSKTLTIDIDITINGGDGNGVDLTGDNFDGTVVLVGSENEDATVTLRNIGVSGGNNVLFDNPDYVGGGIQNYADLTLDSARVFNNVASYGGGVYNVGTLRAVNGSQFVNNEAEYYGGLYNRGEILMEGALVAGNKATYYGGGLGTYSDATISNSRFVGNVAAVGGGIYAQVNATDVIMAEGGYDYNVAITNSTIVGNVATGFGGGVWFNHTLDLSNSIVYGNVAASASDVYETTILADSKLTAKYSDVGEANVAVSGTRVISSDPNFVDYEVPTAGTARQEWQNWDLHLAKPSAALDAGSNKLAVGIDGNQLTVDALGNNRYVNGIVDMGALETQESTGPTDIAIVVSTVTTDSRVDDLVATLSAVGGEGNIVYSLVDSCGGLFKVSDNFVVLAKPIAAGDYHPVVRATDSEGKYFEKSFDVTVINVEAPSYETPTIVSVGRADDGSVAVQWTTNDPAKEYVVNYRVNDGKWKTTSGLTGTFGWLQDSFVQGDIVEVKIMALASSQKQASDWSDSSIFAINVVDAFSVKQTAVGDAGALFEIVSNFSPYAYWKVDWQDGTISESVGLSASETFGHIYGASGNYTPVLYVNNNEGYDLGEVIVVVDDANVVVDETKVVVVSNEPNEVLAPIAITSVVDVFAEEAAENVVQGFELVDANAEPIAVQANFFRGATNRGLRSALNAAREKAFAEIGEVEVGAIDSLNVNPSEGIFDEAFLNDLFEN